MQVFPRIKDLDQGGTMLFTNSYFEFIRLRNFLKSQNASFCLLGEYGSISIIMPLCCLFYSWILFNNMAVVFFSQVTSSSSVDGWSFFVNLGIQPKVISLVHVFGSMKEVEKLCFTLRDLIFTTDIRLWTEIVFSPLPPCHFFSALIIFIDVFCEKIKMTICGPFSSSWHGIQQHTCWRVEHLILKLPICVVFVPGIFVHTNWSRDDTGHFLWTCIVKVESNQIFAEPNYIFK